MIRAVLFDLDDTLYPESDWRASGFDAVASAVADRSGHDASEVRLELDRLDSGIDRTNVLDDLVVALELTVATGAELVEIFRTHMPTELCLFPEALDFLSASTIPTGIITDGHWRSQLRKIEALDVRRLVGPVIATDLLLADRRAWKPAPLAFTMALGLLGIAPAEVVYVADNALKDFVGPNHLGMQSVHLRLPNGTHNDPPPSTDHQATWTVDGWSELVVLLGEESR